MLRAVFTADIHWGAYRNGPEIDGINGRLIDICDRIDEVIKYIQTNKIHHLFVLGDLFKDRDPSAIFLLQLAKLIMACQNHGIKLYIIPGNHDQPKLAQQISALTAFVPLLPSNIQIISEPTVMSVEDVVLHIFPYMQSPQHEALAPFVQKAKAEDILLMHGIIEGCVAGEFEYEITDDDAIPIKMISKFRAVIAGDIHKQQHFKNVWYPGSLERLTFNDEKDEKGFLDISIPKGKAAPKVKFVRVHARKMTTIHAADIERVKQGQIPVKDTIVRVTGCRGEDVANVKRILEDARCYYIASIRFLGDSIREVPKSGVSVPDLIKRFAEKVGYQGDIDAATKTIIDTLGGV